MQYQWHKFKNFTCQRLSKMWLFVGKSLKLSVLQTSAFCHRPPLPIHRCLLLVDPLPPKCGRPLCMTPRYYVWNQALKFTVCSETRSLKSFNMMGFKLTKNAHTFTSIDAYGSFSLVIWDSIWNIMYFSTTVLVLRRNFYFNILVMLTSKIFHRATPIRGHSTYYY